MTDLARDVGILLVLSVILQIAMLVILVSMQFNIRRMQKILRGL